MDNERLTAVAYRTNQMTVICLKCAHGEEYTHQAMTPIYSAEAEQLRRDDEDKCAECERPVLSVAGAPPLSKTTTVGYRTVQESLVCLQCAESIGPPDVPNEPWTPIYLPEAAQLCSEEDDCCDVCGMCLVVVASEYTPSV